MAIKTEFEDGILHSNVLGELTFEQAMQHLRNIEDIAEKTKILREILDFTECKDISLSSEQLLHTVQAGNEPLKKLSSYRLAIFATSDFQYGLSRMFQIFHENVNSNIEIKIFKNRTSALNWLKSG